MWAALHFDSAADSTRPPFLVYEPLGESDEVMRYAGHQTIPTWLACVYLGSNVVLNTLNFYWFGKMIETIRKRFTEVKVKKKGQGSSEKEE